MPYKQNIYLPIQNKIFRLEHIKELAELLFEELQAAGQGQMEISVKCFDNTSFMSEDLSLLDAKSPILKKRIRSFEFAIHLSSDTWAKIGIFHGANYDSVEQEYSNSSFIEISGSDKAWINSFNAKIQEWYEGVPIQNNLLEKRSKLLKWLAFGTGTILFGIIVDWFNVKTINYIPYWEVILKTSSAIVYLILAFLFGGFFLFMIVKSQIDSSPNIWPIVEIQVGPDHLMKEKQKRSELYKAWTLVWLPLILSIISTLIMSLI